MGADVDYSCQSLLDEIVHVENIYLREADFGTDKFGGMLSLRNGVWVIHYNSQHPPNQQRFTIAHELGHYFRHQHVRCDFFDDESSMYDRSPLEVEANNFASEILLPEQALASMLVNQYRFYRITWQVGVSYSCLRWRLVRYLKEKLNVSDQVAKQMVNEYEYLSDNQILRHQDSELLKIHNHDILSSYHQIAAAKKPFF